MSDFSLSHSEPQPDVEPSTDADSNSNEDSECSITVEQQMVFGDDGDLEPESESVATSLETFGADVDHRKRSTRLATPAASRFGIDDRTEVTRPDESDQYSLFADVEGDQQTLGGEDAAIQCLFDGGDHSYS